MKPERSIACGRHGKAVAGPGPAPARPPTGGAVLLLALGAVAILSGCKAFDINVGTKDPIKLDPIQVDLTMRVDVYQYTGNSEEEKQAVKNVENAVESQRNRMAEIQTLKNSRYVGENHLGLLSVRNLPAGKDGEYVQKTVDEENADRAFLMTDTSNSSGTPLEEIRRQQWETRAEASFQGEWIQVSAGAPDTYRWVQKKKDKEDA
ncbi:MAG: DUF1318 domain-containing protein [Verrucomicrobiales bacterium]